jgi:hypothetical protein
MLTKVLLPKVLATGRLRILMPRVLPRLMAPLGRRILARVAGRAWLVGRLGWRPVARVLARVLTRFLTRFLPRARILQLRRLSAVDVHGLDALAEHRAVHRPRNAAPGLDGRALPVPAIAPKPSE